MIEILRLRNFQPHEDLLIKFGPITVIRGESDRGKTSIVRALGWVLFNDLRGDSFIRNGAEWTKCYLRADGQTILRQRGKHNLYKLDGECFKAFGAGAVPEPIKRLLNVSEVNLQTQHEGPLWVMDSPGQVSKKLNDLADLEVMDRALAATASRIRKVKAYQEVLSEEKELVKVKIKETKWVVEADADLQRAEGLHSQYQECGAKIDSIRAIVDEYGRNAVRQEKAAEIAFLAVELNDLQRKMDSLGNRQAQIQLLVAQLRAAKSVKVPDVTELVKLRKEGDAISERLPILEAILKEYKENRSKLKMEQRELATIEADLKEAQQGQCPLCGRS